MEKMYRFIEYSKSSIRQCALLLIIILIGNRAYSQSSIYQDWTSWTTVYSENELPEPIKVQISFKLTRCTNGTIDGWPKFRINNQFERPGATVTFKFGFEDCEGQLSFQSVTVDLGKSGIDDGLGNWFMGIKTTEIYDIKYNDPDKDKALSLKEDLKSAIDLLRDTYNYFNGKESQIQDPQEREQYGQQLASYQTQYTELYNQAVQNYNNGKGNELSSNISDMQSMQLKMQDDLTNAAAAASKKNNEIEQQKKDAAIAAANRQQQQAELQQNLAQQQTTNDQNIVIQSDKNKQDASKMFSDAGDNLKKDVGSISMPTNKIAPQNIQNSQNNIDQLLAKSGNINDDTENDTDNEFKVTIFRQYPSGGCTSGYLAVNGKIICYTLELPWKDNQEDISSIPTGTYNAILRYDHSDHWRIELLDVPNSRTHIQIHVGNKLDNTKGCILVGDKLNANLCSIVAGTSLPAYQKLMTAFYGTITPDSTPDKTIIVEITGN
ncbi:MAG TPA: DUF5675 family protein [Ferruginibacter sp.]|jgi:hypothetical protein|nr:DUF5675 family protein [Ferruginibacter sp.]